MANTQQEMRRSGAAYSNGTLGIGGKHSSDYYINQGMSASDWARVSSVAGKSVKSAADFWNLTSEQMALVANNAPDLYSKIKSLADDGYKDASKYMDEYIEYYTELNELQDSYREKLTDISFDSMRDNFKSELLDMTSDYEDFVDNIDEMLLDALIESMMSDKYSNLLHDWYEKFAESMTDGTMSDEEQSALREMYDSIVKNAISERDALIDMLGIDTSTSQSAKSGTFTTMTQDQGTKLEGMFTNGLRHWSSMDERMESVVDKMSVAEGHLARIEENTGVSAGHLATIMEDIKKIVRDGLKMK
jgi:hypothetical protein